MTTIKAGGTAQKFQITLKAGGGVIDLTGKTVQTRWLNVRSGAVASVDCQVVGAASGGVVEFALTKEQMGGDAGGYFAAEWVVHVTAGGAEQVAPFSGVEEFFVEPNLSITA